MDSGIPGAAEHRDVGRGFSHARAEVEHPDFRPQGTITCQPRATPWVVINRQNTPALNGPYIAFDPIMRVTVPANNRGVDWFFVTPFQGSPDWFGVDSPGRCPGLSCFCPFGTKTRSAT